jgi:hypothetical protein
MAFFSGLDDLHLHFNQHRCVTHLCLQTNGQQSEHENLFIEKDANNNPFFCLVAFRTDGYTHCASTSWNRCNVQLINVWHIGDTAQ